MSIQVAFSIAVTEAAKRLHMALTKECEHLSAHHGAEPLSAQSVILAELRDMVSDDSARDGRACMWRARLRLFADGAVEPVADSDPDLRADLPGQTLLVSLPALATWLAEQAAAFHGAPCSGLESGALKRKLNSLRTQLSNRRDGTGVWRIPYTVTGKLGKPSYCTARCDVVRES